MPTRLQYQTTECGVAALAMILAHYGRHVPMEEIRRATGVSRDCLNAGDMVRAGRQFGLDCAAYSREPDDLRQMAYPFVAHLQFIHFVIVEGMTNEWVLVSDPACGRSRISVERFHEIFTGIVVTFKPGPGFVPGGQKDRLYLDLWRRIGGKAKALLGAALILACLAPLTLTFTAVALGDNIAGLSGATPLSATGIAAMAAALAGYAGLSLLQASTLDRAYRAISARLTGTFLRSLIRRPFAYLSYRLPSEQMKSVYDNDLIARLLCRDLLPTILTIPSVVVFLIALLHLTPAVGDVVVVILAIDALCLVAAAWWRADDGRKYRPVADDDFRALAGALSTIENRKIASMDVDYVFDGIGNQSSTIEYQIRDGVAEIAGRVVSRVFGYAVVLSTALIAALSYLHGASNSGEMVAALFLACATAHAMRFWPRTRGKYDSLHHALLRQDDLKADSSADPDPAARASGGTPSLRFQAVVFGHSPTRAPLLNGVDFAFQTAAEQVGITGPSGGGKSTFASVAAGLYTPWSGTLETGPHVMWVDKSPFLFDGTVRENLSLWRAGIDDEILWQSLRDACVDDVVATRPGGLEAAIIARGRNFSGGQRQRLEIARALSFDPKVLILDEALDALNPSLEARLRTNLRQRGCALVIISHRASTLAACDRLLHFHAGRLLAHRPVEDPTAKIKARAQIETLFAAGPDTATRRSPIPMNTSRPTGQYVRRVRFVRREDWLRPHMPLIGNRRGDGAPVKLIPANGGYRIDGTGRIASPEEVLPTALCEYPPAALDARTPAALFRSWAKCAIADLTRATVLSVCVTVALLLTAFLSIVPALDNATIPTWKIGISLMGGLAVIGLLEIPCRLSLLRAAHRMKVAAISDLFQRLIRIQPGYFKVTPTETLARAVAAVYRALEWGLADAPTIVSGWLVAVGGCLVLAWIDLRLGVSAAAVAVLLVALRTWEVSAAAPAQTAADNRRSSGRRFLFDTMQGIARLRVVGAADRAAAHWRQMHDRELEASSSLDAVIRKSRILSDIAVWAAITAITLLAASSGANGAAGGAALVFLLAWLSLNAAHRIGDALGEFRRTFAPLPALKHLLDAPLEPVGIGPGPDAGIELRNAGFHYEGTTMPAIAGISLRIAPGEVIALVGPSGSGKSTLLRLLLGFDLPTDGGVHIDGRPIHEIDIQAWRNGIGVVQQDDRVDNASTIRGIISGTADVGIDEVWQAADLAQLGDDIRAMPMGMQTIVEHGKLSTGQEQRLLIARQLLRRPKSLILDEATNAIPEETQARLFADLRAAGIGCILATHRESAIAAVDRVILLDAGHLIWQGPPAAFADNRDFMQIIARERLVEGEG